MQLTSSRIATRAEAKTRLGYPLDDVSSGSLHLLDARITIDSSDYFDHLPRCFELFANLAAHDIDWRGVACGGNEQAQMSRR